MKKLMPIFILFLLSSITILYSQPILDIQWDRTYQTSNSETINDAIILPDGTILLVGTSKISKKRGKDGLLVVLDPKNGEILFKQPFGTIGDDEFKGVAVSAEDGSFYIVGSTERNKHLGRKKDAWLMQLSLWGDEVEIIRDTSFGGNSDDSFEKIVWMRKAALIAGYQNKASGRIWALSVNNKGIQFNTQLGQGYSKELIGLARGASNHYWLCGNTRKTKELDTRDGDIWFILLDEKGYELNSDIIGEKDWEQVHGINRSLNGNLLITGESWWRNEDADSWVVEIDDNGFKVDELKEKGDYHEKGSAILQTAKGVYWVANTISEEMDFPTKFTDHDLVLWYNLNETVPLHLEKMTELRDNFEVNQLLKTPYETYLLTGNNYARKKGQSAIRLICIKNGNHFASKGLPILENTSPILVDKDRNNILSPNESGSIQFTLKNAGGTAIAGGKIEVAAINMVKGLKYKYKEIFFEYLGAGESTLISLPLATDNTLAAGTSNFNFKVLVKEGTPLNIKASVTSGMPTKNSPPASARQGIVMGWKKPDITLTGDRNIPTIEKNYTIQVAVTSDKALKTNDFKVRKNGTVLQDERNKPALTDPVPEKNLIQYTFTYTITDLKEGENTVYVESPDGSLEPIIINYQPKKPNLHILAIGPNYDDLKFTAKDARDFALLASQQASNGFFDQVFIDTLLSPMNTTKSSIEINFASLAKRAQNKDFENHIKGNDYVMIFFSGHGTNRDEKFRLLPTGFNLDYPDETMVDYKTMLEKYIKILNCKTIIFIDACLSGNAKSANASEDLALSNALIRANQSVKGVTAFTSCSEDQSSYEDAAWKNGAFTKALIEGIQGQPIQLTDGQSLSVNIPVKDKPEEDKIITIEELEKFLQQRVPDLVRSKGVQQIPMVTTDELDKNVPLLITN